MSKAIFSRKTQRECGKPARVPFRRALVGFSNIIDNLKRINGMQKVPSAGAMQAGIFKRDDRGYKKVGGKIGPLYSMDIGNVGICIHRRAGEGEVFQDVYINDLSKRSTLTVITYGQNEEEIIRSTSKFSRKVPDENKLRQVFTGIWQGVKSAGLWALVGAAVASAISYVGQSGSLAQAFENIVNLAPINAEGSMTAIGGLFGVAISFALSVKDIIKGVRDSFGAKMMKFIRDPENKDAVNALERM